MTVRDNLERIRETIRRAAERSGRKPSEIGLVAASKTVPPQIMLEAALAGVSVFGENRVQEAVAKKQALSWPEGLHWHFIGHLQKNKARVAVETFDAIESVHSLELAQALDRHAREMNRRLPVLMEINVGLEDSKSGFYPDVAIEACRTLSRMPNLRLNGLMAIPPYRENPEDSRSHFRKMRELRNRIHAEGLELKELSMGMSHDFEVAIEEGATLVRIGTALFGDRTTRINVRN